MTTGLEWLDLIERLRDHASTPDEGVLWANQARYLMNRAADLIERMRAAMGPMPERPEDRP